MYKELAKRKADVIRYLEEEFKNEPRRWWHFGADDYIPTKAMGSGKNYDPHKPEETIVKYDFKRALISSALFFTINFLAFLYAAVQEGTFTASFWTINIVLLMVLGYSLIYGKNKGILIFFNQEGFKIASMPGLVPWDHLAASYIRKDDSGESTSYYLLLFYYDETKDEFVQMEQYLGELDLSKEEIASQIEYWKMKAVSK